MGFRGIVVLAALLAASTTSCDRERGEDFGAIPVTTEIVKRTSFEPAQTLLGVVRAARSTPLVTVAGGTVRYPSRFVSGLQTGARVSRGEQMATLVNDRIAFAETQARLQMDAAAADLDRARRSFEQGVVSGAEHAEKAVRARLAQEAYKEAVRDAARLHIVAPHAGTLVVAKAVSPGTIVAPGTVLAEIASNGEAVVESAVPAADRDRIVPGLEARILAGGRIVATGRISEVATVIDPTGTARVVASIGTGTVPPPGSGVELQVSLGKRNDVITVPEEAVVAGADGPSVFTMGLSDAGFGQYRARRVRVELGGRSEGRVEITSGLRDGDRVVVAGADALTDDARVLEAKEPK